MFPHATKLQFLGKFWLAGYELHTPAMCNKLTMVFLQTIKWCIQELPVNILKQTMAAAKRSGNLNSELGGPADRK